MSKEMSRRSFLKTGTAVAAGIAVAPNIIIAGEKTPKKEKKKKVAPSDKLNILGVGIGGRGAADLAEMETENIIGLCDVDWKYADHVFNKYPQAKKYNDYRVMYDELLDKADAVMIATADHTHAIIAAQAMAAGKHVYVEKPLTLTVYEARLLTKLAAKYRVATQMGNQGASNAGTRKAIEWLWNGEIGEVKRVDCFTDSPIWPQGLSGLKPPSYQRMSTSGMASLAIFSLAGKVRWIISALGQESVSTFVELASTLVGYPSFRPLNGTCMIWQAISPMAPVPKSHHPRKFQGV